MKVDKTIVCIYRHHYLSVVIGATHIRPGCMIKGATVLIKYNLRSDKCFAHPALEKTNHSAITRYYKDTLTRKSTYKLSIAVK